MAAQPTQSVRAALVTGAGTGIGRAVALSLQADGFHVTLNGRRRALLEATAGQARSDGGRFEIFDADVAEPQAVAALFSAHEAAFGRLDVLFNNAGAGARPVPIDELSFEEWKAVVDVNLNGAFLCARAAMALMKRQQPRGGRIINNGSISAQAPRPFSAPYTATKHAMTGLTKSISLDGRAHDIACSQIDIGNAATEMTEPMAAGILQANGERMVEPRIDVAHVAEAVLYMAKLPLEANVQFMTLMATKMPLVGRG